jgi:hypothetical protein
MTKGFHGFAVASSGVAHDRKVNGDRNIGDRAKELADAYFAGQKFDRGLSNRGNEGFS